jgi:phenylacetate-CoA ligase
METDFDQLMRFDAEIARAERFSPEQMARYGQGRLAEICDFARRNTAYYRKRLAPVFAKERFDFSRWLEVPMLTRELARSRYQELRAARVPPYAGDTEEKLTSGSTGAPLRFLLSAAEQIASQAFSKRAYVWWGMDGTKNFGGIHAYIGADHQQLAEEGSQGWRYDVMVGRSYGCPLHWSVDFMLDWIPRQNIRYLSTRPSNLEVLAEAALARGVGRSLGLEVLLTVGGPLLEHVRELCQEAFGLPVRDTYGSLECGNIAVDCPQCGMLHINEEGKLVEVLREDGTPCLPGETGRVLITPYFGYAMPLVRYDSGDYAELAEAPNPCGRPHRSLRRVLGRHTEAFVRRDGSRFFPSTQAREFERFMAFEQMQLVQTDYDAVEVRFVPKPGQDRLDREAVQRYVREELGPQFVATLVPVPEIPRLPGAKFLYHICQVPQQAARSSAPGR